MALINKLNAIGDAVRFKTGDTKKLTLGDMVTAIYGISGGDDSATKDVVFCHCDGTELYSYTFEEARALTELPALPTYPDLICQGWNYDLETIKNCNHPINVGATYITDDGKTRLYLDLPFDGVEVPLYYMQSTANTVTVDWGDGSEPYTDSDINVTSRKHTYTTKGRYVITLAVADGYTFTLGSVSDSTNASSGGLFSSSGAALAVPVSTASLYKVEIGHGITHLAAYLFMNCYNLKSITISNDVSIIYARAFQDCKQLKAIIVPNSVASIGEYAFYSCALESISIPNSVTNIGDSVFYDCYSLKSVSIPNSVTSIGRYAFRNCNSLESISIPNSVTKINDYAFCSCNSLESISIPGSVTSISSSMFDGCQALNSISIPNSVTNIGDHAFLACHSLNSISIPNSVTSIGRYAFRNCNSLKSISIPGSVTKINDYAFQDCISLCVIDFLECDSIPTLASSAVFNNVPPDFQIHVPAALYDRWIAATNWSILKSNIVAV